MVDTYLPRLKMQMRAFAAFTTPTANLFQTLGLSFPPLILLRHLPKRLYATSTNGPVFARPSRPIVCAAWSNGVAGRQTSRLRAVGLGLGRKKSLALELEPGLIAGWSLGKRNLGATHRCFLTLSHFGRSNVKVASLDLAFLVIISPLQDRTTPFTHKTLCNALDANLGSLAFGVKVNYLANAAAEKHLFVDWKLGESIEDVALNIVSGETAVVQGLQEVFDSLEEIGFRVENGILNGCPVEKRCDLREKLKLVGGRNAILTGFVVSHTGVFHGDFEIGNLFIDFVLEIDIILLASPFGSGFESGIHGTLECPTPPLLWCEILLWNLFLPGSLLLA